MDRRNFKVAPDSKLMKGRHPDIQPQKADIPKEGGGQRVQVLQELGNQLQVKAEKMRLLAKAEEGLEQGDFNPYATVTVSPLHEAVDLKRGKIVMSDNDKSTIQHAVAPSAARKKRRERKSQAQPGNPSTVNIKQYRPGYTWNKGGRMKELRIRHLARKFLWIWKNRVFGGITPSQAGAYYRRRLMWKCYRAWNSVWWELRKEWRLVVRAECHHRYVLFTKTFRAWKEYIVRQRVKNKKIALAERHATCCIEKKYLDAWQLYIESRRNKIERKQKAVKFYNENLTRRYWGQWMSQYEVFQHRQHMEAVALQFWAYRLQAQYWLVWQHKMTQRKKLVLHQYKAVRHHNTVVVKRCLQAWIRYWARRCQKQQEKVFGERVYERMLVNRCYHRWLENYRFRQAVYERQDHMDELAARFQKRRIIKHWKHYIEQRREEHDLLDIAISHHNRKLLMAGFSAFRLCVVQKKLKLMRNEMADQLRYKQLLQYGWNTWLLRCEDKEELQIVVQSQKARKHYRLVLMRKCLYQLYNYAVWRQNRQSQYARADAHYYMTEVPKYMFAWKTFVQLMKNKRENEEKCVEFRRENLQARFFYSWMSQFEVSREYRMNERMAILHYDEHLGRRFFSYWKQKTVNKQLDQENEAVAAAHYDEVLLHNHLTAWRSYIQQLKKSQQQDVEASTHYTKNLLKTCFKAWTQYARRKMQKSEKRLKARQHYERILCKKMVQMWLHYVDMQRSINKRVEVMYHRQCQQCLRSALLTWRENVGDQKAEREAEVLADRHYQSGIMSKVFKSWHRFAAIHAYKKSETRQWVTSAREHLDNKMLRIYFMKWKENFSLHKAERMKYNKAKLYHEEKVKQRIVEQWKIYTQESIRKTLLQKQSDWFLSVRLKARYFVSWKHAMVTAEVEKEKTNLALWHWCLTLHRKVVIAWYTYAQHRKQKKALVAAAMERRRQRLLKDGVKKWLCVADDLSAMRKTFAAQQQAQTAFDISRRVLKIGLHWKHWAAKINQSRISEGNNTAQSHQSMPVLSRGDDSVQITPRSVVSVNVKTEMATDLLMKKKDLKAQLPAPLKTVSPGRPVVTMSRITNNAQDDRSKLQPRAKPRRPDFLVESLKRAGLFSSYTMDRHENFSTDHQKQTGNNAGTVNHVQAEGKVEKLNLSNLVSNMSQPSTARSDVTITNKSEADIVSTPVSVGQYTTPVDSARSVYSESQSALPEGWLNEKGQGDTFGDTQNRNIENRLMHKPTVPNEFSITDRPKIDTIVDDRLLNQQPVPSSASNIRLMTPADFIKSSGSKSRGIPNICDNISDTVSLASQSVASTPRIVCQIADHGHPLSETRSFRVSDFKSPGMSSRSTSACTTPRDQLMSLGFETSSSTQRIEREIVTIRNRLKLFDQKKKKLRTMQKQLKQLSGWLEDMEHKGQSSQDSDVIKVKQEIQELTADISMLKTAVEEEKVECTGLVDRVKELMSQLNTS